MRGSKSDCKGCANGCDGGELHFGDVVSLTKWTRFQGRLSIERVDLSLRMDFAWMKMLKESEKDSQFAVLLCCDDE